MRKILYGSQIQNGELAAQPQEAEGVKRIFSLYLAGMSQQQIADALNADGLHYSSESPMWTHYRIAQTIRNPHYAGKDGYPILVDNGTFCMAQEIMTKKARKWDDHPALCLTKKLRCGICGSTLRRISERQWKYTLRFHCDQCGMSVTILDAALLAEVERQAAEYEPSPDSAPYALSGDAVRLANAINRGLEHPEHPEDVVSLILQGISARYYTQKIGENPDWELTGIFADRGISGTSLKKRTEFNKMIAACKRGRVDLILTKSLSRFARNTVDCLEVVRMLRANGIGVIFEKENINTLTECSEFLITLFSGFAQAESESISKNVVWGIQKSREAGKVPFQYTKLLGYRRGADGKPEIDPEEAEVVKHIYRRYLDGCSLAQIKKELEADGIPTASGIRGWTYQVIRNILSNERYIGDALLQKTYTTDCISKTVRKTQGDRPMVYVEKNHPAIISKAMFYQVREEMTRRSSKRKVMQKTGKTEQGKYSAKYALSELLVCGECGTPYKRCTWARNGKKRIVWRCISRPEFGTKYCHTSPHGG